MTTYAISVGVDPNDLGIQADEYAPFKTQKEALVRLIAEVDGRMYTLRKSKARARRKLRALSQKEGE